MFSLKTSVGIELAGKDLRIAILRSTFGKLSVVRSFALPGFAELSADDQKKAVLNLVKAHRISHARVFLSVPHEKGIVRQVEFPVEVKEKLKSAVELQLESLCPWPMDDVYWDFSREVGKPGARTITVSVAFIPRSTLDPWIEFFRTCNLPLSGASLSSLTCAHGAASLWNASTPTVVLNCESDYVEGSLVQGGKLSSFTLAGTETESQARKIVERLVTVGRVGSPEAARLVVYGSAADVLEGLDGLAIPIENAKREDRQRFGALASALLGLKRTAFDSNLVPRALRYRQSRLQLVPTYALIALALLLGIALAAREPYQLVAYTSEIEQEITKIAPDVHEVSGQEAELNALSEKYRALTVHFQNRDVNLEVLRELARVLPPSAWLSNYTYQDGTVTLSGFADSASEIQKVMEDSALFKDVQFTTSLTRENAKDRFSLKAVFEVSR